MSPELGGGRSLKNAKGVQGQSWKNSKMFLEWKTGRPLTCTTCIIHLTPHSIHHTPRPSMPMLRPRVMLFMPSTPMFATHAPSDCVTCTVHLAPKITASLKASGNSAYSQRRFTEAAIFMTSGELTSRLRQRSRMPLTILSLSQRCQGVSCGRPGGRGIRCLDVIWRLLR